jgi:hypothetical protein
VGTFGGVPTIEFDPEGLARAEELFGKGSMLWCYVRDEMNTKAGRELVALLDEAGVFSTEGWFEVSEKDTERAQSQESQDEIGVPNQHALAPPVLLEMTTEKTIRVSVEDLMTLGSEVRLLREQVTHLQSMGSAQLEASRAASFEIAARVCEMQSERNELNDAASYGAQECAKAIRELAAR